jgi:hypothetical protein
MTLEFFMKAALAGFFATYIHMLLGLWAPRIGLPRLDFAGRLATLSFADSYAGSPPYALGLITLYLNGIFFALLYAAVIGPLLPGTPMMRGLMMAGILYVASQAFFVPLFMHDGFFGRKNEVSPYLTVIMVYGVFGLVLGWLAPIRGVVG